jgi:TrmH family RNA methyltransferase
MAEGMPLTKHVNFHEMPALIASRTNPRVKQLRAAFAGHARLSGGLVAIEGEHLLFEDMRSGMAFKTIFVSQSHTAPKWTPRGVEIVELTDEVFASAVDTQSPQGIAALQVPPIWGMEDAFPAGRSPVLLIAAGLQDPGNLGTLIRSAEAFGASAVLTTPGTVSEWNQKALRASAGSVFRVPVVGVTFAEVAALKSRGVHFFAAVADDPVAEKVVPIAEADLTQVCALMIGNEGAGLSEELLALADTRITIPTPGRIESLNAAIAGSLLLYEASRQRASVKPGSAV